MKLLVVALVIGGIGVAAFFLLAQPAVSEKAEAVPGISTADRGKPDAGKGGELRFGDKALIQEMDLKKILQTVKRHEERIVQLEKELKEARSGGSPKPLASAGGGQPLTLAGEITPDMKEKIITMLEENAAQKRKERAKRRDEYRHKKYDAEVGKVAQKLGWDESTTQQVRDAREVLFQQLYEINDRFVAGATKEECWKLALEVFQTNGDVVVGLIGEEDMVKAYEVLAPWKYGHDDLLDDVYDRWKRVYKDRAKQIKRAIKEAKKLEKQREQQLGQ
ncbi:MAG: hypothetical protein E3J72_19100 [Planctomycetota bacterium]|nr:MAG: hypothetical protein E3J72_19100 [Planctomycetota bacterium]